MDLIKHYQFIATLSLRTPLAILERHAETHPGPTEDLPRIASQQDGIWIPITKSWSELAGPKVSTTVREQLRALAARTQETMASDVGPVPEDGGDYLPFLKAFRAIVESSDTADNKRTAIKALASKPRFRVYATVHNQRLASWPL